MTNLNLGKYNDCLTRQIKEALRIQNRPGTVNSKGEFGGGRIPRLKIDKSEYESKMDRLKELKEEEEIDEKWKIFLKDLESRRAVKAKRKLDLPSSMVGNLSKKRRLYSSTTDMTEATMSPGIEGVKMILAIEYFPENKVLQKRRGVAIPTHSENQQTKTDYPAVCYEKLLAIDYVPVSEVPTLR